MDYCVRIKFAIPIIVFVILLVKAVIQGVFFKVTPERNVITIFGALRVLQSLKTLKVTVLSKPLLP